MVEILMQRRGQLLVPIAAPDAQELLRLPERRFIVVQAEARTPAKLTRWYWAMLMLLCEATGRWPTKEMAHRQFMVECGYFESLVIDTNGSTRFTPASVAGWGLEEWRTYLDRLLPLIIERYVGETRAQFRDRVDAYLGIKFKEAWENG